MIFCAVVPNGVEEIEIFLDDRMLNGLREYDPAAWQGLIEFVEDDIARGGV